MFSTLPLFFGENIIYFPAKFIAAGVFSNQVK